MHDDDVRLDPATLRALAAELDAEEHEYRKKCPCSVHTLIADRMHHRATSYRTRAIQAEQGRDDA